MKTASGLRPIVKLISDQFYIPQLNTTRKIWILLPHDYYHSQKKYPVLYLQDAQNLFFDDGPFGSWNIDDHLEGLSREGCGDVIVVAIDHGGSERIKEYSPYFHRSFGKGEGVKYAEFVIHTLKKYVDDHYRTLPLREHTGIGGSSMGGLISAYIGIVNPEYFSKLMIFSPSFWFSDRIFFDAFKYKYSLPMRMYIYGGERESKYMRRHINRFKDAVMMGDYEHNLTEFAVEISPDGEHSEYFWSRVFPKAMKWLYYNK